VYDDREEFFELAHRLEEIITLAMSAPVLILDMYPWLKHVPIMDVCENFFDILQKNITLFSGI
jgi:hypothetical protein